MNKLLCALILIAGLLSACERKDVESERERTVRLLAGATTKEWRVNKTFTDGIEQAISFCDSSYVLTLRSDFTWNESFSYLSCYRTNDGFWSLNDENNVITINFLDQRSGLEEERQFVIIELSENFFMYEFAQRNILQQVRLISEDE